MREWGLEHAFVEAVLDAVADALVMQIKRALIDVCFFAKFQHGYFACFLFDHQVDDCVENRCLSSFYTSVHMRFSP